MPLLSAILALLPAATAGPSPALIGPVDGPPARAEIVVLTDRQEKYLGGQRTYVQSSTVDGVVDVAVRPIAVDLFGFTVHHTYNLALQAYRESVDHPVLLLDTGDVADLACAQELALAGYGIGRSGPDGEVPPDLVSVGNHDINSFGNFRSESDLIGWLPGLGDNYRERIWVGSCARSKRELDLRRQCKKLGAYCDEAVPPQILEKDDFIAWASERLYGQPEGAATRLLYNDGARFQVESADGALREGRWDAVADLEAVMEGNPGALEDAEAIYDAFWVELGGGRAMSAVEVIGPQPDPGRRWLLLGAAPVDAERNLWLLATDSTDQLQIATVVPGAWGTYSRLQVDLLKAAIAHVRRRHPDARFAMATHFPHSDLYPRRGQVWRRTGMRSLAHHPRILFHIVGHTHTPGVRRIDLTRAEARRRGEPLLEYVAHSVLDYPNGGLRVRLPLDPEAPPEIEHFGLHAPYASERARDAFEAQRDYLAEYRAKREAIEDRRLREVGTLEVPVRAVANIFRYMIRQIGKGSTTLRKVGLLDVRPLMEHQFEELMVYLQVVTELLDAEPDPELRARSAPIRDDLTRYLEQTWTRSVDWNAEVDPWEGRLDLFRFPCEGPDGDEPNCVEAIQRRLRDVPSGTDAYQFMQLMALEGARIEYCTGPDPFLDEAMLEPPDCEEIFGESLLD